MLIDFNSAKHYVPKGKFLDFEGTLHYAAPEALDDSDDGYNPVMYDIWSMGVCLYCMYFGKLPYDITEEMDQYASPFNKIFSCRTEGFHFDFMIVNILHIKLYS